MFDTNAKSSEPEQQAQTEQADRGRNVLLLVCCMAKDQSTSQLTLRLHDAPGDHGSHGSPKRSARLDFGQFCSGTQVLLGIATFSCCLSRYPLQTVR